MTAFEDLAERAEALVAAIDAGDAGAIERANARLATAVAAARSSGAWRDSEAARAAAIRGQRLVEAARVRVNYHADRTRQRLQALALLRGSGAIGYDRQGRIRG